MNMDKKLQVNLILQSLPDLYGQFNMNYHMNKIDNILPKLLNMLATVEGSMKSSRGTVLTMERVSSERKSSFKKKKELAMKQKNEAKPKKQVLKKADDKGKCFHGNVKGHWRRNYLAYLTSVKSRKNDGPFEGTSDILIIETNLTISSSSSQVLDFGSNAHLYISMQGLKEVRGLREGKITLWVDNGARVAAVAIEIYHL